MVRADSMAAVSTTRRNSRLSSFSMMTPVRLALLERIAGRSEPPPGGPIIIQRGAMQSRRYLGKRLNRCVGEEGAVELRGVSWLLSSDRLQAGGEGVVPLQRKAGDVAENAFEVLERDITGKRDGVKACAANRGIGEQGIDREAALVPALSDHGVFEDREHQSGIARLLDRNRFQRPGNERCRAQRATGS